MLMSASCETEQSIGIEFGMVSFLTLGGFDLLMQYAHVLRTKMTEVWATNSGYQANIEAAESQRFVSGRLSPTMAAEIIDEQRDEHQTT